MDVARERNAGVWVGVRRRRGCRSAAEDRQGRMPSMGGRAGGRQSGGEGVTGRSFAGGGRPIAGLEGDSFGGASGVAGC